MPWLSLNNRTYTFDELRAGKFLSEKNFFANDTFAFCHAWLTGQDSFTQATSGSTGNPKKINLKRSAMIASARATAGALQLKEGFTALLCLDPNYIAGRMMLVRSFVTGMNMVAVEPKANPLEEIPAGISLDFAAFVPYQLSAILSSPSAVGRLNTMRSVLIGGAALDASAQSKISELQPAFYATYGMTETVSHVALKKCNPPGEQACFHLLPGVHIRKDDRGCLVIEADYLDETVITNDLVEIVDEDQFLWLGRFDSIINSGGVKIIPETLEIEIGKAFEEQKITNRFFVYGNKDGLLGSKVVLVIEGKLNVSEEFIQSKLKSTLSRFEMPKEIKFIPAFIETNTLKINRAETIALLM